LFSVFHMQFYGFFPRVVLGACFGYLLYWSGSVWLSSIIHALNNTLVVFTSWQMRRVSGGDVMDIDKIGADSSIMIVVSLVLVTVAFTALNCITKKQNCVTH
ncbi:MAG: CPBP family intramembrane metalloprotease, partial [Duncaniella sp.]|nr:CPBP family intramembrane metalloprotease [Duncaniella sp.]